MLSEKILESLECALVNGSSMISRHIIRNPLTLSCGHSICKECVPSSERALVRCNHCKEINQAYLKQQKVSHSTLTLFETFLKQLFEHLQESFQVALNVTSGSKITFEFNSNSNSRLILTFNEENSFEENIKLKIDLVREDIHVRFESLRHELDLLQKEMIDKLESIKQEILKSDTKTNELNVQKNTLKQKYNELCELNLTQTQQKSATFYEYQTFLQDLIRLNDQEEDMNSTKIAFQPSDFMLDTLHIGKIEYNLAKSKDIHVESSILKKPSEFSKLNELCEFPVESKWKLIYKATTHGFSAKDFHRHCDGVTNTLVLIQTSDGSVFGGFTSQTWNQTKKQAHYKSDKAAFLFSLSPKMSKYRVTNGEYAMFCDSTQCAIFGAYPSDLFICNNSNLSQKSYSNFPSSYGHSTTITRANITTTSLGSNKNFNVKEVEVYSIMKGDN